MKGKIVLLPFPFTDLTAAKIRPALVLCETEHDVVIAFISSKFPSILSFADIPIKTADPGFSASGLKVDSVIKLDKIATVLKSLIVGELGELDTELRERTNTKMRELFQI